MKKVVAKLGAWWRRTGGPSGSAIPYEVACRCGHRLHGVRQVRYQAPRCPQCGRAVFVLPVSALPPANEAQPPRVSVAPGAATRQALPRGWMGVATGVALGVAGMIFALYLLVYLVGREPGDDDLARGPALLTGVRQQIATGSKALGDGNYQRAVEELTLAQNARQRYPDLLSGVEAHNLSQLHRQANLLADLLTESLGEIVTRAGSLEDREWQAVFTKRYKDKTIVFDADVRRDAAGQYSFGYVLRTGNHVDRVALEDLKLLTLLPLAKPSRLLFGGRLSAIQREPPGRWVVHFDADSGVLLTHPGAAAVCCFGVPEGELREVLERQSAWLAELP